MNSLRFRRRNPAPREPAAPTGAAGHNRRARRTRTVCAIGAALLLCLAAPSPARACACGCGIYEVGTNAMFPDGSGVMTFLDYDYQDQNRNWSGDSRASAADNGDKDIRTGWFTLGYQDMLSRAWGLRVELPYERRHFETTGGATGGEIVSLNFSGIGDIRVQGLYTGLSPDMSSGLTFGAKLPTGSYRYNDAYGDVDRDSQIGSGSTDLLLGGYRRFNVGTDYGWSGFVQGLLDVPLLTQVRYRPGTEFDAALGIYYNGWSIGSALVSPVAQMKLSVRGSDAGANATHPVASGFERLVLSPGIEIDRHPFKVYSDVELPVYQRFTGNQLAASLLFRLEIGYMF